MNKTYRVINLQYKWPNMRRDVEDYVRRCKSCQKNKILTAKCRAPLQITTTAERPFEKCYLEVVGPLPVTFSSNKYVLTFQNDLSKYVVAVSMDRQDAETVARAFVERIVLPFGTPQVIQTDQGANCMSEMFKNICCFLKIKKIQSTVFHPESQGSIERSRRVFGGIPSPLRKRRSDELGHLDTICDLCI